MASRLYRTYDNRALIIAFRVVVTIAVIGTVLILCKNKTRFCVGLCLQNWVDSSVSLLSLAVGFVPLHHRTKVQKNAKNLKNIDFFLHFSILSILFLTFAVLLLLPTIINQS